MDTKADGMVPFDAPVERRCLSPYLHFWVCPINQYGGSHVGLCPPDMDDVWTRG